MSCGGSLSCDKSTLTSQQIVCEGYFSCHDAIITPVGYSLVCGGVSSCENSKPSLAGSGTNELICYTLHSCLNMFIMSSSSNQYFYVGINLNSNKIAVIALGVFGLYNTSIYSNGNDLDLYMRGYYNSYGLDVYCNKTDSCRVYCYGNSCVGLTLQCESTSGTGSSCGKECMDKYCESYYNDSSYDSMVAIVDNMIKDSKLTSILPIYSNSNQIYSMIHDDICSVKVLNGSQTGANILMNNGTICCLSGLGCRYDEMTSTSGHYTVYCVGTWSCSTATIINADNVYIKGSHGAYVSKILNFQSAVYCESENGCLLAKITNGPMLVCLGYSSCSYATISNVSTIIAIGEQALQSSSIKNANQIYLLGYTTGMNLVIEDSNNISIFCQNGGCDNVTTTVYCKNFEQGTIDSTNIFANINTGYIHNLEICGLVSQSPTEAPTLPPTLSTLNYDVKMLIKILQDATIIIPIVLAMLVSILTIISCGLDKKNHKKRLKSHGSYSRMFDNDSSSSGYNVNQLVDYKYGFGRNASHLVIFQFALEIYDIYTDIVYSIELAENQFILTFQIFIVSIIATFCVNVIILIHFWTREWKNNISFRQWFYQRSAIITAICFVCVLTDIGLITSLFTSHIFGHSIFYSPMSMDAIKTIQVSSLIGLLIEHLPQLLVEFYVIIYQYKHFSNIQIAALIVSLLDVGLILTKSIIWCVVFVVETKQQSAQIEMAESDQQGLASDEAHA